MDVVRVDERDVDWTRLSAEVEAGVSVQIMRGDEVFATVAPGDGARNTRPEPHASWKAAGVDWDRIRRLRDSLPYDPSNSVEEMRREARY